MLETIAEKGWEVGAAPDRDACCLRVRVRAGVLVPRSPIISDKH